ncbi:hypothetical protein [Caldifermentibacillus hisashii]
MYRANSLDHDTAMAEVLTFVSAVEENTGDSVMC